MLNMNMNLVKLSSSPLMYTLLLFVFLNCFNNFNWDIMTKKMTLFFLMIFFLYLIYYFYMMVKENYIMGFLSYKKKSFLVNGFLMFILSEVMVFLSLFWSYIHNAFTPNMYLGNCWPPKGIIPSNPTSMIIFGTIILLSSSFIIMISHNSMLLKNFKYKTLMYFFMCMFMGLIFIDMQILEMSNYFMKLNFNFNDSIFSSSFLFTTSLHATHVLIGLIGLTYSFIILNLNMNNKMFYLNFEFSIWYWHFVDYIWIFVFSLFYYFNN